jgi:exopolysaccharide production protein ExoY
MNCIGLDKYFTIKRQLREYNWKRLGLVEETCSRPSVNLAQLQSPASTSTSRGGLFSRIALGALGVAERPVALLALVFLSPVLIVTATAVFILSRRSPLLAHRRVGKDGRKFWLFKFRTMWGGTANHHSTWFIEFVRQEPVNGRKPTHDPRITSRFAAFLRKHSIDELPQLANVLIGEMSLVGPRPLTQGELTEHYGIDKVEVLSVKPGITGLWQTMGRSRLTYRQRLRLDLFLARRHSIGLYLRVLARTIPRVLSGIDAW